MKHETEKQKQNYVPASIEIIRSTTEDIVTISKTGSPDIELPIDPFDWIKP